jgi:hypothetical protein
MFRLGKIAFDLFVVLLLLVFNDAEQGGEARGKIKSLAPDKGQLVLANDGGATQTFVLDEDCKVTINNRKATLTELQVGEQVTVEHTRQGDRLMATEIRCKRD